MLNKMEILVQLQDYMNERRESNNFAFEDDIKSITVYRRLFFAMS